MNKKKKITIVVLATIITVVLLITCICIFSKRPATTNAAIAYEKTIATYFKEIDIRKLHNILPNSIFTIQCGEDQMSDFFLKANDKQMINILKAKNEFSESATDLQFYVFDEYFAISSNKLLAGHLYGFDMDVIDLQLQDSSLMGMQGLNVESVLKDKKQKLDNFKMSVTDMWLIGQTDIANVLDDAKAKHEESETQYIKQYELEAEQAKKLTSTLFGVPASVLQYLVRNAEYLLLNDDVYAYQTIINALYEIADFAKSAERANRVIFTINKTSELLESIRFESANEFSEIWFKENDGVREICLTTSKDPEWKLNWVLLNADNSISYTANQNGTQIFSGSIVETKTEFRLSIHNVLTTNEMKQIDVAFILAENINEVMELPAYIDIGNMDVETTQHFFEHMSGIYAEGYDEFANILIFNAENKDETDYIEVPNGNIYQGEIILVDNEQVTAKIVKVDTETPYPSLLFEMSNKLNETLYFMTHSMLIQNQTIDMNTGMDVAAGETKAWTIQLTKDNLGFDLEQIDSIYFPRITISTEKNILFEISHRVKFAEIENVPVTELPETLVYNAAHFKVYADKNTEITEDGIQTTVYFVNNSSRNIYVDIDAGAINDIQGECVEFFPCYANTICKKTLTIKGDFTDMTEQDLQKIVIALYIRDRDESQLTGLQSMEISFVENIDG